MDPDPDFAATIADASDSDTSTSVEEENTENLCDNPTRDILADGLLGIFKTTTDQLQERVRATRVTQMELKAVLDGLSTKLHGVMVSQKSTPIFDEYVQKLITVKHKVAVIYNSLYTTQVRIVVLFVRVGKFHYAHISRPPSHRNVCRESIEWWTMKRIGEKLYCRRRCSEEQPAIVSPMRRCKYNYNHII